MRSFMKEILLGIIMLLVTIIFPLNTYALEKETDYIYINNTESFKIGTLSFSNLTYVDNSSTSTQSFGLIGTVINQSNSNVDYNVHVYYYDEDYRLLAEYTNTQTAVTGSNTFNLMTNMLILKGDITEVSYYKLEVIISDYTISTNTNMTSSVTPSKDRKYQSYDYVIDKYDINMVVNENNTFDITETITAYFNVSKHGIIRTIPLRNTVTRLDGTKSINRSQVTNLSVNKEYTASKRNGKYKIQIGSANRTLTGEQTYVIKYTYNIGKDPVKDYDELYYNIIGNEWDTVIGNITFTITMPKEFDSSKLGFSSGTIGSTNNTNVKYNVSGNTITGNYKEILGAGKALTVRCELPEGYFRGTLLIMDIREYIFFFIPLLFLAISILLWYKFGRDDQVVETVEFYPPEGLNSLDIGFLYKGRAENKDVTSLLIYLANKGYIQISNKKIDMNQNKVDLSEDAKMRAKQKIVDLQNKIKEEKQNNPSSNKVKYYENLLNVYQNIDTPINYEQYGLTSSIKIANKKNNFIIKKLKDYDGDNLNEQWFMEGLFEYGRTEVTDEMLYNKFYTTSDRILSNMNNKQNQEKIYEKTSLNKKIVIILMMIVTYCLITISPISTYGEPETLIFALSFPGIGFSVMISMLLSEKHIVEKVFSLIWGIFFGGIPWVFMVLPALLQDSTYIIEYIVGSMCIIGMAICLKYLSKRTPYGNEMLGKLRGFKNFLETAEKEKLEALVMENPTYFYDILPYTYVLGVSDKWMKKFETISLQSPTWYDSTTSFDVNSFGTFINSTMSSTQTAMASSPSSSFGSDSSGGSSSGGGSSGGGSGGGGGSSW